MSWPEPPAARSMAIELANRDERKSREAGGPMPPRVVRTMGRKARPRPMQPVKCFAFFSRALSSKVAAASLAAVCRWLGRRGQRRDLYGLRRFLTSFWNSVEYVRIPLFPQSRPRDAQA